MNQFIDCNQLNSLILDWLDQGKVFFCSRPGGTENEVCLNVELGEKHPDFDRRIFYNAQKHAGIVTNGSFEELQKFSDMYLDAICNADVLGVWYPQNSDLIKNYSMGLIKKAGASKFTGLEELLPWNAYFEKNNIWTMGLRNKRVLVIHPFAESVQRNYHLRNQISVIKDILPEFDLSIYVPPVTNGEVKSIMPFHEVVNFEKVKLAKLRENFDVALIAAGGYGAVLGRYISNEMNKPAIHLGGALQLLFGISGRRWQEQDNYKDYYSKIIDHTWTRPLDNERITGFSSIEAGCYW